MSLSYRPYTLAPNSCIAMGQSIKVDLVYLPMMAEEAGACLPSSSCTTQLRTAWCSWLILNCCTDFNVNAQKDPVYWQLILCRCTTMLCRVKHDFKNICVCCAHKHEGLMYRHSHTQFRETEQTPLHWLFEARVHAGVQRIFGDHRRIIGPLKKPWYLEVYGLAIYEYT